MAIRIIDERTLEKIKQLLRNLHEKSKQLTPITHNSKWFDNQQVCLLLDISLRTLQSYRDRGILPYSQIGHKCYYKSSDVEKLIQKSRVNINSNKNKQ